MTRKGKCSYKSHVLTIVEYFAAKVLKKSAFKELHEQSDKLQDSCWGRQHEESTHVGLC